MNSEMEGMLDTYLFETNGLLDRLDEMLVDDEKKGDFSTDDINEIFRIMHTIKGSSAMMEFNSLSVIAHRIEDLFFFIRDKGIDFLGDQDKKDLFELMFKSEDYLRGEVEKVENGQPLDENIDHFQKVVDDFLARLKKDETQAEGGAPAAANATDSSAPAPAADAKADVELPTDDSATVFIHILLEDGVGMENLRAFMIVNALKENGIVFNYYPKDMDTNAEEAKTIISKGFFLAFESLDQANTAEELLKSQPHIKNFEVIDAPKQEPPKPVEAPKPAEASKAAAPEEKKAAPKAAPAAKQPAAAPVSNGPVKQSLISVNLQKLDALNDLVGEIVITESMVTSSPALKELDQESLDKFMKSARQLRKLTDDLQDISMSLRMVSISGVFQKMNRIVRDMKTKLNKDVRLTIIGEDTEVDKTIVDSISDPIMHIVRNSMDHGIEATKEERIAAGKDPQGEIVLSATHTSSEVVISVKDDGYGMDPEKLLDKAEEKGILTKPREAYSKREALGLIMVPGFSTNKQVTEYSGRGVGMDVVRKNVESVGGIISIESEVGEGTTITMKIPLTLAIVDGMKISVGDSVFTIPISNIRQTFKIKDDSDIIRDESGNQMVEQMGEFYPIVRLDRFYNIKGNYEDMKDGILVWVEASDKQCCLYADDLIGSQQVVVKPMPSYLANFNLKEYGINGCTILGDGTISVILDVLGIYNAAIENA